MLNKLLKGLYQSLVPYSLWTRLFRVRRAFIEETPVESKLHRNVRLAGGIFQTDSQERQTVSIDNVTLWVDDIVDLHVVEEIFVIKTYSYTFDQPSVVLDVGMNVGAASLCFANQPLVQHVIGYEPFAPTRVQAQHNLDLNPQIKSKIRIEPFGWYDADSTQTIAYDYAFKTVAGIFPSIKDAARNPRSTASDAAPLQEVTINLKRASDIVKQIQAEFPSTDLVLKLDCEGSEYAIVADLASQGLLSAFKVIMAEWHIIEGHTERELLQTLVDHGFAIFSTALLPNFTGMIYAIKRAATASS